MLMMVQGTTPKNSSIEVQHCTALMVTWACFIQPSMTAPSLAILRSACFGDAGGGDVVLDGGELGLRRVVGVFHVVDAAEDFREVDGLDGDAAGFEDALGVADGVEGRGTRADGADAEILEALDDAADRGEPFEVGLELGRVESLSVQRGERIGNAVLHEVVAGAHFAAEAVAAGGDGHGVRAVGRGLDEHRNLEAGEANGVDDAALFAEVGQGDDDAVDFVGVLLEELGAPLRFGVGFDGAVSATPRG